MHQQKGCWPWRFAVKWWCVNWERLQRRSRPWVLKQVEVFSFTTAYPLHTVHPRRWLMHAVVSWTNQRNGHRTRSTLVDNYIRCTWKGHREEGVLCVKSSFKAKSAGLFHSDQQFLIQHGVGWIRWKIQTVKACVRPEKPDMTHQQPDWQSHVDWPWVSKIKTNLFSGLVMFLSLMATT